MRDNVKKTSTTTSQYAGVSWSSGKELWKVQKSFSNPHVRFNKHLGYFGVKGDRSKGEGEAGLWSLKVDENIERINSKGRNITDLAKFQRLVSKEIEKLK